MPELRTSTMTHIVWCPPEWRAEGARDARRPARAPSGPHDLPRSPSPGSEAKIDTRVELKDFQLQGLSREVLSEVIELRLRGSAAAPSGLDRAAAARLRPARLLPLARRARLGERARSPRSSASPTGSSSTRRSGATSRRPTRCLVGAVRPRRRLGHRVLAHAALAAPARRALAGDRRRREAPRRRARAPTPSSSPAGCARG